MDLVTVCNDAKFLFSATWLAESFLKVYPKAKVILCVFGDLASSAGRISESLEVADIPQSCPHAWDPRLYYYKTAALKIGMQRCNDSFIWLDSRNRVVGRLVEVEEALNAHGRFFDQYPNTEFYKIKNYTAAECVRRMGLTQDDIKDWYGYQSLVQAYTKTPENEKFIDRMLELMSDPLVAGPSNYVEKPDGADSHVRHHRNDLSVLSLLIPQFGFDQPYDRDRSQKYGDRATYERFGGCEGYEWDPRILTRQD